MNQYKKQNQTAIHGIKEEWNSDVFCVPAITDKVSVLRPDQREMIEEIIDGMIAGEEVKFIDTPK